MVAARLPTDGADQRHGLAIAQLFDPNVCLFVVRLDGLPVGCGALFDDYAEVKRMSDTPLGWSAASIIEM